MEPWFETFAHASFQRSSETAHDLKTPLNIAVLNLELMRMRVRALVGGEDTRLEGYGRALESELRRLAAIFDAFFVLSTPPPAEGEPSTIDISPLVAKAATEAGCVVSLTGAFPVRAHESRLRAALKFLFDGAATVLRSEGRTAVVSIDGEFSLTLAGHPAAADDEVARTLRFYYTMPDGAAELSLASARLIAETYGGGLSAFRDRDKFVFRMTFPPAER